jgi:hypothetical protein
VKQEAMRAIGTTTEQAAFITTTSRADRDSQRQLCIKHLLGY